jgi:hypothetical protein
MPRRKMRADELTTEEVMKRLFPKKGRKEVKRIAQKPDINKEKPPYK